jgi:hypothetical protein
MMIHDELYALSGCACGDPYNYRSYTTPHSTYANRAVVVPRTGTFGPRTTTVPYYVREGLQTDSVTPLVSSPFGTKGALAGNDPQKGAKTPPADTTPEGRAKALEVQWAEARDKAQTPEYAGQGHAQGSELPMSLEAPLILASMTEIDYYLDPNGWERCTLNEWLNGTPSEDDLGFGSSIKKKFTAPVLEDICGDHAFGNQYDAAFDALKDAGAPARLIKLLRAHGQTKLEVKKLVFKKDAENNMAKGAQGATDEWKSYLIWGVVIYAAITVVTPALLGRGKSRK